MTHWLSIIVLAFAVSLDSGSTGVLYGVRRIRIALSSIILIACCSGLMILLSMELGSLLYDFVSPRVAKMVGAFILIGIGLFVLIQVILQNKNTNDDPPPVEVVRTPLETVKPVLNIEFKKLGIVIQILRTPSAADMDRSGNISTMEATFLGLALSLDGLGAGIGASLLGFNPIYTAVSIAFASGLFLWSGLRIGTLVAGISWVSKFTMIPGFLLMLIGFMKLL